jgi:diguanylate cyclase (GGDEF)-like protein/PAS domain S-box-containing protein
LRESERRWRALFADSPVAIVLLDHTDTVVEVNAELCTLFGVEAADIVGQTGYEFGRSVQLSMQQDPAQLIAEAQDGIARTETRLTRSDGSHRWALMSLAHVEGPTGKSWTLGHLQDITERKAGEQRTIDSEVNLRAVARVVKDIQSGADARQTIVDAGLELAGAAFVSLLEPTADLLALRVTASTDSRLVDSEIALDAVSATVDVFRSGRPQFIADPANHPRISPALLTLTQSRSIYAVPVLSSDTTNGVLLVSWTTDLPTIDDRRAAAVTLLADHAGVALRQAALLSELESMALTDSLTQLPNRRNWNAQLALRLAGALRTGRPLTVALADLDHFKRFNDALGHQAGDAFLVQFAVSSTEALRVGDLVARWGGEEFAIALPDCSSPEAGTVLERVRHAVPGGQTCSIGYATWDGIESGDDLLARADRALYAAKHQGRNRIVADRGGAFPNVDDIAGPLSAAGISA